jgi:hypothetical protein
LGAATATKGKEECEEKTAETASAETTALLKEHIAKILTVGKE